MRRKDASFEHDENPGLGEAEGSGSDHAPWETLEFATNALNEKPDSKPAPATFNAVNGAAFGAADPLSGPMDEKLRRNSVELPSLSLLADDTKAATEAEHKMTLKEGLRLYPKAIGWSMLLSLAIVMEGYDTVLLTNFYALPEFKKHYGKPAGHGDYEISTAWQTALSNGAQVGEILGLFLNGIISERYGYRLTLIGSLIGVTGFIFLAFFAVNIQMLEAAEILCGIPWGVFQTLTTVYAAEVMPVSLRVYLTSYVNLCWIMGQFIGAAMMRGFVNNNTQWSYRIPFAIQWFWSISILIVVYFAPESPWWLVRHGRDADAKRSLLRLTSKDNPGFNADQTVAMMKYTNELEKSLIKNDSYLDCFKGVELRRTEIACMVWAIQNLCGFPLVAFAAYFFVQLGITTDHAFDLNLGTYGIGFLGTVFSWILVNSVGRRTLYLWGTGLLVVVLLVIGGVGTLPESTATAWAGGGLLLVFTFIYDFTIGPVCYCLVPEITSARLRVKTVVLARNAYNFFGLIANVLMPKMLNPIAWNWKGRAGFFWAGSCLLCFIWTYYRLPEPKGLTSHELDILFQNKASAKKFRRFQVMLDNTGYFSVAAARNPAKHGWRGFGSDV